MLKDGLDALSTHGAEEVFAYVEKGNAKGTGLYCWCCFSLLTILGNDSGIYLPLVLKNS